MSFHAVCKQLTDVSVDSPYLNIIIDNIKNPFIISDDIKHPSNPNIRWKTNWATLLFTFTLMWWGFLNLKVLLLRKSKKLGKRRAVS